MPLSPDSSAELRRLLTRRLEVIADHDFRDRDPAAHLEALKSVSEALQAWHEVHRPQLDPNLEHFLTGASYQKALAYLDTGHRPPCGS